MTRGMSFILSRYFSIRRSSQSFCRREKRIVELDGGRNGPFDRGACTDLLRVSFHRIHRGAPADTMQDTAKIVQEKYIAKAEGDINFTMLVLAGEPQ